MKGNSPNPAWNEEKQREIPQDSAKSGIVSMPATPYNEYWSQQRLIVSQHSTSYQYQTDWFIVMVGLQQGPSRCPLLLIISMELISRRKHACR